MPMYDENGWPVDLDRLPSWEQRGDQVHKADAIFRFFQCPCGEGIRGPRRRPHRIADCKYTMTLRRPSKEEALAARVRAMTMPITPTQR